MKNAVSSRKIPTRVLATSVAALLGFFTYTSSVNAQQYWDGVGGEKNTVEGGAGTWNETNVNWTDATGTTNSVYTPLQTAIFGGVGGGTITVGQDLGFSNLNFTVNGYVISGSSKLSPVGMATLNGAAGTRTIIQATLSGTGGINVTGAGTIVLSGTNTYSGNTNLNSGTLVLNSDKALGTGTLTIAGAGTTLQTEVDGTVVDNDISVQNDFSVRTARSAVNFELNGKIDLNGVTRTITGVTASSQIKFGGEIANGSLTLATNFTAQGDYVAFISNGANNNTYTGLTTVGNGAFYVFQGSVDAGAIKGNVLVEGNGVLDYLGGSADQIADDATVTINSNGNNASGGQFAGLEFYNSSGDTIGRLEGNGTVGLGAGTLTVGAGNFTGIISDGKMGKTGGGLTKTSTDTLILSGANSYTGTTNVDNGILQAGAANTFSSASAVTVNSVGTLDLNSFNQKIGSLAGDGTVTLGTATLTTGTDNTDTSFAGAIQGTGGVIKIGTGTMTLSGANTYTGATTINGGRLVVDTANNAAVLDSTSALVLGGGVFELKGVDSTAQSQTMAGLTITGGANGIVIGNNSGTSTTLDLGAGNIVRSGAGTIDFSATDGTLGAEALIKTGQANNASGIIGAWATVNGGAALAANDGAGNIVAYTNYTATAGGVIGNDPTKNVRIEVGDGATLTLAAATTDVSTLTQNSTTASVVTFNPGEVLRVGSAGGILITPTGASLNIGTTTERGTLTAGGADNTSGELVLGNFSSNSSVVLTVNSVIADNGTGVVSVTKTGTGAVTLTAANTYTGDTTVNQGALNLNTTGGNAIAGNVVINGGSIVLQQANQIADTATVTISGGLLEIGSNNETVAGVQLVSGTINGTSGILTSTTNYDLQSGTVGAILGGTVGLDKTSTGTVVLSKSNTYTGTTTVSGGTLRTDVAGAISSSSALVVGAAGTFDLNGFNQTVASLSGSGSVQLGVGYLTVGDANNTVFSGVIQSVPIRDSNGSVITEGGGLTKVGSGTLTLSGQNLYSGKTTISAGTLQAGVANAILKSSAVTISSGATFDMNNFVQSVGSIAGGGTINMGTANLTTGSDGTNTTFSGVIQGSGGLIKVGGGTLTLSGANTFTGTTDIQLGAISLSGALVGPVTMSNGSKFEVKAGGSVQLGANVTIVSATDGHTISNGGLLSAGDNSIGINAANSNYIATTQNLTVGDNSTGIKAGSNNSTNIGGGIFIDGELNAGNNSTGVDAVSGNTIQNSGRLSVAANGTGIRVLSQNTVTNEDEIIVGNNSTGIEAGSENTLVNQGTIQGGAFGSRGIILRGSNNTATNALNGIITATKAVEVLDTAGQNHFVNYGQATGTGGTAYDSTASTENQKVTNVGVINGDVLFGSGDDTMTIATGSSVKGVINGGTGTNTLRLVGTGSDSIDISTVSTFSVLEKGGGGSWDLTGTGTFAKGTTVFMGDLFVQGNLISDVQVLSEGALGGTGMVTGDVFNSGILRPGKNGIGKFTIDGNYRQTRSGSLEIEVRGLDPGQYDLLKVAGRAQLDGSLRIINLKGGPTWKAGDRITFLTAGGGVDGEFSKVENPFNMNSMIQGELEYDSNSVSLVAVQGSFQEFAKLMDLTPNQRSTSRVIDAAVAEGKNKKMLEYLNAQQLKDIPEALDRVAPEEMAAMYRLGVGLSGVQTQNVERRMEDLRLSNRRVNTTGFQATGGGPRYSAQFGAAGDTGAQGQPAGKNGPAPRPADQRWGAFLNGMGEWIRVGDTENARGYDLNTGGVTTGVDYKVSDNFSAGVSTTYAATGGKLNEGGKVDVNSGKASAYATYYEGGFHADAMVGGGYHSYETKRMGLEGAARGQTEGVEVNAHLGGGFDWTLDSLTLGALTAFDYTYLSIDEYTERGSLAPLTYPTQGVHSLRSRLGFKAVYDWQLGGVLIRPEARFVWQHEFGDRAISIDSQLASGAGGIFTVDDPNVGRDSLLMGLGGTVLWGPRAATYLFYDGELYRKESESHNISGGVRISF